MLVLLDLPEVPEVPEVCVEECIEISGPRVERSIIKLPPRDLCHRGWAERWNFAMLHEILPGQVHRRDPADASHTWPAGIQLCPHLLALLALLTLNPPCMAAGGSYLLVAVLDWTGASPNGSTHGFPNGSTNGRTHGSHVWNLCNAWTPVPCRL